MLYNTKIKVQTKNENSSCMVIDPQDFCMAFQLLSHNSLGIWAYLASAPNNSTFYLNQETICRTLNVNKKSYYRALQDFIRYGYLCQTETSGWLFNTKIREPLLVAEDAPEIDEDEIEEETHKDKRTINININITGGIPTEGIKISKEVSIPPEESKTQPNKETEKEEEKLINYFWDFQV